ncbi:MULTISPECIES: [Fe-Fe] hydrogenase large subunit C-terminal domain-containing protein [Anaerotruncus]|uniref:Iron hydrogenase n=3 Tax=Anaerotruncus TaxID=244127 RepID=A0A498CKT9_9FIRM|nr:MULTISPECIES: [Fe-Fe] hydrogenase large subunit C-terminal domain-containing protein [Anaerotruncus]MBC3939515.1 iron hydrogenase [Anaerotruncus massiliensis (ex Togo et al. 2019)]MCQ4895496.1 iron hydrogenase [Anaerotruncus sp. DFI.9.16]RLL08980.1 iron hydrogenase [Anaerotruncus massiliensis (ex Liu et al. 2021)]
MATFQELYQTLLAAQARSNLPEAIKYIRTQQDFDPKQLDCLLNPQKHPLVWRTGECGCAPGEGACERACAFDAIHSAPEEGGRVAIDVTRCVGCSACIDACAAKKLEASRDAVAAMEAVRRHEGPVYALVAPAFMGQFSEAVTPGMLRSAFLRLGFDGMIEVALFADILTLKEALEFDKNITREGDFQLTSCCCPLWIAMIRKIYSELQSHLPASVSPMIACGRSVKALHPDALTIFVGPCIAKKAEAREKDLVGAVDYVLTFQEVRDIFAAAGIDPAALEDRERDHSSRAGRIYARTGGVSEAVRSTVERLNPHRKISMRTRQADGVPGCRALIDDLLAGKIDANFFEGMGCVGGCVGGPKRIIPREEGERNVDAYGGDAASPTPIDNPYVIELLGRLGYPTVESLLTENDIFSRKF